MSAGAQMRFCILGSGSEGNCAFLQTPSARVLIDAGFSARHTGELLAGIGVSWEQIDAVFITHEHSDHAAALGGLARHGGVRVFANAATARAVQAKLKHRPAWQIFETGGRFDFLDLQVESFSVPHDAMEPVGFLFSHNAHGVAWVTDLGHAPRHVMEHIRGAEVLVVEANHSAEMLRADSKRPWATKQRIGGRHGHLSNQKARELLEAVAVEQPAWRQIYLTHLSRDCNSVEAVLREFAGIEAVVKCPFAVVPPGERTGFYVFG